MCSFSPREGLAEYVNSVIDLSIKNVERGGLPFASLIIDQNGDLIGAGVNQVSELLDCTAHAEIQAIREASSRKNTVSLNGATLVASGEPCGLCYMAILMAGIKKVAVVSDRYETRNNGFDYLWTYQYFNASLFDELNILTVGNERKLDPFRLATMNLGRSS